MSRFLRFVVEETLANGADAVKETTVALAVFDRASDFNPKLDPVVRNEARRLRGKLEVYYAGPGVHDPILISIPKGGYAPVFTPAGIAEPVSTPSAVAADPPILQPARPADPLPKHARAFKLNVWWIGALFAAAFAALGIGVMSRRLPSATGPVSVTPLTLEVGQDFDPAISPDGQSVAFAREGDDGKPAIYIQSLSGNARRLTFSSDNDLHPAWSPDGQTIAFLRVNIGTSRIMLIPSAGGKETQVAVPGRFDPGHQRVSAGPLDRLPDPGPAWSPDGKSLVFRQCLGSRSNGCPLHVVTLANLLVRQLTEQVPGASDMSPAWSPDGRRIAFARFLSSGVGDVYTIPAAGGASTRVTNDSHNIRGITWTRDSRNFVISSNRGGIYGLWKVSAVDHTMSPLSAPGETAIQPVLSPDNQLLIYADATTTTNIWRFDRETQTSERFIASTRHSNGASWSPDGRRIAFASDRSGSRELWIANADGSQARQLSKFGRGDFGRISWSPDSTKIVFEARPDGRPKAFVIAPDGGAVRPLHEESFEQRYPSWSHDGQWIYLVSNQGGKEQIWRVREAGDAREMLCDCAPGDIFEAPDGHSLFIGPMPGIWELPLPAGKPHAIPGLENINPHRWWTVGSDGIWFYDETPEPPGLSFYSFASRKITHITTLDRAVPVSTPSLSVSPDGRYLLFSRFETAHSKLMTIRGFALDR